VAHAHAVAAAHGSVVYYAALRGGGYCAELVTAQGAARGAVCSGADEVARRGLSVTVPFTDPVRSDSPVTVSGRVADASARSVELVYPDGGHDAVALGARGFYVADVPAAHLGAVHAHGLMLIARDADGDALAQAVVPSDAITPPSEAERPHDPIELDTVSTGGDLTKMLRVRGDVHVPGVARVTLRYSDGVTVRGPVARAALQPRRAPRPPPRPHAPGHGHRARRRRARAGAAAGRGRRLLARSRRRLARAGEQERAFLALQRLARRRGDLYLGELARRP
jgi:hypothetical protein